MFFVIPVETSESMEVKNKLTPLTNNLSWNCVTLQCAILYYFSHQKCITTQQVYDSYRNLMNLQQKQKLCSAMQQRTLHFTWLKYQNKRGKKILELKKCTFGSKKKTSEAKSKSPSFLFENCVWNSSCWWFLFHISAVSYDETLECH